MCNFYLLQALVVNEFHDSPLQFYFTSPLENSAIPTLRVEGDAVLKEFGFHYENFRYDIFIVFTFAIYYVLFTYYALTRVPKSIREVEPRKYTLRNLITWSAKYSRSLFRKKSSQNGKLITYEFNTADSLLLILRFLGKLCGAILFISRSSLGVSISEI